MLSYASQITYRKVTNNTYATSYWGSQALAAFPNKLIDMAKSQGIFIDITAGGAGFPYKLARDEGLQVGCNDRNLYAYNNLMAVFNRLLIADIEEWFESFCCMSHPDNSRFENGYIYSNRELPNHLRFNAETASYVDGLILQASRNKDFLMLAAISRTLVSNFTFRALSWSNTTTTKRTIHSITAEEVWLSLCRTSWRISHFANQLPRLRYPVTNMDALISLEHLPTKGAVIYTDPAWPWSDLKDSSNPYSFFTYSIGNIIAQNEIPRVQFWSNKDATPILMEVSSWIRKAFELGAHCFCLSTQSTNFPEPSLLYETLGQEFILNEVIDLGTSSLSQQKPFKEWYGFFFPK